MHTLGIILIVIVGICYLINSLILEPIRKIKHSIREKEEEKRKVENDKVEKINKELKEKEKREYKEREEKIVKIKSLDRINYIR